MYEIGKVYKTTGGYPAKILWVTSSTCLNKRQDKSKTMTVLLNAHSEHEAVYTYAENGKIRNLIGAITSDFDLTEDEYLQEFTNP